MNKPLPANFIMKYDSAVIAQGERGLVFIPVNASHQLSSCLSPLPPPGATWKDSRSQQATDKIVEVKGAARTQTKKHGEQLTSASDAVVCRHTPTFGAGRRVLGG